MRMICWRFRTFDAFYSRLHRGCGRRLKRQEAEEEAEEVIICGAARSILKGIQPTFHWSFDANMVGCEFTSRMGDVTWKIHRTTFSPSRGEEEDVLKVPLGAVKTVPKWASVKSSVKGELTCVLVCSFDCIKK